MNFSKEQILDYYGDLTVATVMTLTLSWDHRVIDGAVAAQFLQLLKRYIQTPSLMLA